VKALASLVPVAASQGSLTYHRASGLPFTNAPGPVTFSPDGKSLFVTTRASQYLCVSNAGSGSVSGYSAGSAGALTVLAAG
jgi:hypothetical protein